MNVKLERLDDFEVRAGTTFEGLFMECDDFGEDKFVAVKGLLKTVDGGRLPKAVKITAILYSRDDTVLDLYEEYVSPDQFHKFVPFDITLQVPKGQTPSRLCLYPAVQ